MKNIIFYHPLPVIKNGESGSRVRPYRMMNAFKNIGYNVINVTGLYKERKRAILNEIRGKDILFMYGETANTPSSITNRFKFPILNSIDFKLLRYLKSKRIPSGIFFRDIYWVFDFYKKRTPLYKRAVKIPLWYYDLCQYRKHLDILFMPTKEMSKHIPIQWGSDNILALPPGCVTNRNRSSEITPTDNINLLYVGNIASPLYNIRDLLKNVNRIPNAKLTICCKDIDWLRYSFNYEDLITESITVIHEKGDALESYYLNAHVFITYREHHPYLDITLPIKKNT